MILSYSITMALHFSLLALGCNKFRDIWRVLFLFQITRVSLFGARVIQKTVLNKGDSIAQA